MRSWQRAMDEKSQAHQLAYALCRCHNATTTPVLHPARDDLTRGNSIRFKSGSHVRQLSLQQATSRRQPIIRHRSADDEKSLQIRTNPGARGKLASNGKAPVNRPKLSITWNENRRKSERQLENVEVVAHQIAGRSRPITGRHRFTGTEKSSILYSRQQLAERLRLAWKHREENKANIDIFLAHNMLKERCDSTLSSHATLTEPSTPRQEKTVSKTCNNISIVGDPDGVMNDESSNSKLNSKARDRKRLSKDEVHSTEESVDELFDVEKIIDTIGNETVERCETEIKLELASHSSLPMKKNSGSDESMHVNEEPVNIPSQKADNLAQKIPKTDFSSAKQKRAVFRSGANKAFLTITKSTDDKDKTPVDNNTSESVTLASSKTNNKLSLSKAILKDDQNVPCEKNEISKSTPEPQSDSVLKKNYYLSLSPEDESKSMILKTVQVKTANNSEIVFTDLSKNLIKFRDISTVENVSQKIISNSVDVSPRIIQDYKDSSQIDKARTIKATQVLKPNPIGKSITPRRTQGTQKIDQRSRRTSSAPPQRNLASANLGNRVQVNIVIDTPNTAGSSGKSIILNRQNTFECNQKDNPLEGSDTPLSKISYSRPTRSAPLKRRSKSSKRRLSTGFSKSDEDANHVKSHKNGIDVKTIDVVTMVSLVSSADSDSDIENLPGEDNLINELRSRLPTTPIIKASINTAIGVRKPIKSVSFQRDSFDDCSLMEEQAPIKEEKKNSHTRFMIANNREKDDVLLSCNDTVSAKQETTGVVLPVLSVMHDTDQSSDVQLTDREKRCLAVPIGDLQDKKRKLLKTRSMPTRPTLERQAISVELKEQDVPNTVSRIRPLTPVLPDKITLDTFSSHIEEPLITPDKESEPEIQLVPCEPHFQTPKEKECWQLYRKMCDKGVYVSFDTVLRGMLTPTEYRLRQK